MLRYHMALEERRWVREEYRRNGSSRIEKILLKKELSRASFPVLIPSCLEWNPINNLLYW